MDAFKMAIMQSVGIGGLRCPCCNNTFKNKGYDRAVLKRMARSRLNADLMKIKSGLNNNHIGDDEK